ncbi:MAG: tRNA-dihydrouridine synthase family protein [Thermodesulfobacteriota bacterium]
MEGTGFKDRFRVEGGKAEHCRLVLAPIRGITDCLYRSLIQRHFGGFDLALAPFINPQGYKKIQDKHLRDVLAENNRQLPVVPQLLHTGSRDFIHTAGRLAELGHDHINWNLGCPAPMVVKKKRGSGLLPYPETICRFLDEVCPAISQQLSIKTRLGLHAEDELLHLLPLLNDYPLKEITIHCRLGEQLYRGEANPDGFERCLNLSRHELIYNGDIDCQKTFSALQARFPMVSKWMIGRGALGHPDLAAELKGSTLSPEERLERLQKFHDDLFETYTRRLSGQSHILGRMKQIWSYMIHSFPGKEKQLKRIKKATGMERYRKAVDELFKG